MKDPDGEVLADLVGDGAEYVVAAGGRGGLGNAALASQRRKAPGFALLGEPGDAATSSSSSRRSPTSRSSASRAPASRSLIAAISAARPEDRRLPVHHAGAEPRRGRRPATSRFTVADVPGLIPGASEGKGLGLEFLRHVERCAVLVHVLDCATLEPGRDPLSDLDVIEAELAAYAGDLGLEGGRVPLTERPRLVVLNKIDVPEARELAELVQPDLEARGLRVFEISTASHEGLRELTFALAETRRAGPRRGAAARADAAVVLRPRAVDDAGFTVHRRERRRDRRAAFRVRGAKPERWVRQTDFTNDEAVGYLADRLARLGVEDELFKAGAVAGDEVRHRRPEQRRRLRLGAHAA